MLEDLVDLLAREAGQDGNDHHARRYDGEIADAPVGHAAAEERHLVARTEAGREERLLKPGDPEARFAEGHILPVEHRVGDAIGKAFGTPLNQLIQCLNSHIQLNVVRY